MSSVPRQDSYGKYASHLTNELDTLLQDTQILRQEVSWQQYYTSSPFIYLIPPCWRRTCVVQAQKLQEHINLYKERVDRYTSEHDLRNLTKADREDLEAKGKLIKDMLNNVKVRDLVG